MGIHEDNGLKGEVRKSNLFWGVKTPHSKRSCLRTLGFWSSPSHLLWYLIVLYGFPNIIFICLIECATMWHIIQFIKYLICGVCVFFSTFVLWGEGMAPCGVFSTPINDTFYAFHVWYAKEKLTVCWCLSPFLTTRLMRLVLSLLCVSPLPPPGRSCPRTSTDWRRDIAALRETSWLWGSGEEMSESSNRDMTVRYSATCHRPLLHPPFSPCMPSITHLHHQCVWRHRATHHRVTRVIVPPTKSFYYCPKKCPFV